MNSDIEIAQAAKMLRIADIAKSRLGIADEHLEPYGHYKAKVSLDYLDSISDRLTGIERALGIGTAPDDD